MQINSIFYVVEQKGIKTKAIVATEPEAIEEFKKLASQPNVSPENLVISEVDTTSDKGWAIKQVSWARIAVLLVKATPKA